MPPPPTPPGADRNAKSGSCRRCPRSSTVPGRPRGRSLLEIAAAPDDAERLVFSEYHAAGAISGAFMLRTCRYKYLRYAGGHESELYDLELDPEELQTWLPTRTIPKRCSVSEPSSSGWSIRKGSMHACFPLKPS